MVKKGLYEEEFWEEKRDGLSALLWMPKIKGLLDTIYIKAGRLRSKDQAKWIKKVYTPKKILEIGFGYGGGIIHWHKKGHDINGIEPDKKSVDNINKKLGKKVVFCTGIEKFKTKKKYNLIILSHVFEHLPDLSKFFRIVKKLQKKADAIFVEVPNCENKEVMGESKSNKAHVHHFTTKSLSRVFQKNGYDKLKVELLTSKIDLITQANIPIYTRFIRVVNVILAKNKSVKSTSKKADVIRLIATKK